MHPYFTSRLAEQHRQELIRTADDRRSAPSVETRPSQVRRFWASLWRHRKTAGPPQRRPAPSPGGIVGRREAGVPMSNH